MRYVFFGTPRFAAIILQRLIDAGLAPTSLICNPDKPVGRKKIIAPPPTKEVATSDQKLGIKIFQPETKEEMIKIADRLFEKADFGIVAAYSMIIPKEVIEKAKLGIIGVHPSLLPKYRGPSPIQSAILAGEKETGVTLFLVDEQLDHGPIIRKQELEIRNGDDYEKLEARLAELGAELLIKTLSQFVKNKITPLPQDESQATYTKKFSSQDSYISPEDLEAATSGGSPEKAFEIERKVRALNPEPSVFSSLEGQEIKILKAVLDNKKLKLKRIQRPGKKPVELN